MAPAVPPPQKKQDPGRAIADELRGRHGIESRVGVLASERVEYFRGKEFAAFFRKHPDKIISGILPSGWKEEDAIRETMHLLLRHKLVARAERLYKKPKPGKKRLTKWPRKLVPLPPHEQKWVEDGLYAWSYDLPTSPWLLFASVGLAAAVVLLCLFPLAPYKLKILVLYASLGLVGGLLGLILLRWVVAGASWAVAGRAVWLLPNMLSETVGLDEAFWPLVELEEVGEDYAWWRSHALARLAFAASAATLLWGLHRVSPNTGELTSGAKATHDQLLEWLNLQDAQFGRLGNGTVVEGNASAAAPPPPKKPATEERSAAAAVAAARAAAAQPAQPAASEAIPSWEDIVAEEAAEAAAEAQAAAVAMGGSEVEAATAGQAAAAAVRERAAASAAADEQSPSAAGSADEL